MKGIIAVAHDKGGVGKTTIASNIITYLSKDQQVNVIDLDPKRQLSNFTRRRSDPMINVFECSSAKALRSYLESATGITVLDVGGMDSDLTRYAIGYADLIVTPLSDSQIEVDGIMDFKKVIKKIQQVRDDLRVSVVLNRIHPNGNRSVNDLRTFLLKQADTFKVFDTVLRDRAAYKNAYAESKGVYETNDDAKAATEIYNLMGEIEQWLK